MLNGQEIAKKRSFVGAAVGHERVLTTGSFLAARLPDGAERDALMQELQRIALTYLPNKYTGVRIDTDTVQPHVIGYRKPVFWLDWFHLVDIEGTPPAT